MPLRTLLTGRLRRRRAEVDTRQQRDAERIWREARLTQAEASAQAFQRLMEQGRRDAA